MSPVASIARLLGQSYPEFCLNQLSPESCVPEQIVAELEYLIGISNGRLEQQELGRSIEGRKIILVSVGSGPRSIMLWSQMHGDEPTATLAIFDILNLLVGQVQRDWVEQLLHSVTLHFIPMVNPDGAERRIRQNAVGIDINRDALAAVSPEAQALLSAHKLLRPEFGFNLHDQELRSVGQSAQPVAMSLLAPAADAQRGVSHVRLRAMRIGAVVVRALQPFADGCITRYNDEFEPRAFGDYFQSQGTSTLLIEAGHWPRDPRKAMIRKLNVVALLAAFASIAGRSYEDVELDLYESLPSNGERMFDLLIRGVTTHHSIGWDGGVDIGVMFERNTDRAVIKEIGDLHLFGGLETHSLGARRLPADLSRPGAIVKRQSIYDQLQIPCGSPATTAPLDTSLDNT
jgi:hypothetical protein